MSVNIALRKTQERLANTIEHYNAYLQEIEHQLHNIEKEKQKYATVQKQESEKVTLHNYDDLPAEDALNNIICIENKLKFSKQCNQLLARENETQERLLESRAKKIKAITDEIDKISSKTGWNETADNINEEEISKQDALIHEIVESSAKIHEEIKTIEKNIKKKEQTILKLHTGTEFNKELQSRLSQLRNDIRVRARECRDLEAKLKRMQADDISVEKELIKLDEKNIHISQSLACMEKDKEFLSEAVRECKMVCSRQENVIKAQLARQQQLQNRLEAVMKALRTLELEKDFDRNSSKSALVPASVRQEPENVSQILPGNELIPIETYRLFYKSVEIMRTNLARKNMLVLEKESVIQATEEKLQELIDKHNLNARHGDKLHLNTDTQMRNLLETLQSKQENYRTRLDSLVAENNKLRTELSRRSRNHRRTVTSSLN